MNTDSVTASEIGDYVYCKRGWWLKLHGKLGTTPAMMQGIMDHNALSTQLDTLKRNSMIAWTIILIAIGLLFLLAAFLLSQ